MSRSGYSEDCEHLALYRGTVTRVIRSKRGQVFLRHLIAALNTLPEKRLIAEELISENGECCAIGAVCKMREMDVKGIDYECSESVGKAMGIAWQMAAEIAYVNDECAWWTETAEQRWQRMMQWAEQHLIRP